MSKLFRTVWLPLLALLVPGVAFAHEVYVLSPEEIAYGLNSVPVSPMTVMSDHASQFIFWTFIGALVVSTVFAMSISRWLEKKLDPSLMRLKKYAEPVARITVGLGLIACAYYGALFGPELPLTMLFKEFAPIVALIMAGAGLCMLANKFVREVGWVLLFIFAVATLERGIYMLTYTNYLGEILIMIIGAATAPRTRGAWSALMRTLVPYRFGILRIMFGISLIFASIFAKLIHANLALEVVMKYHLTDYLHFEPHFLVLGAAIVEITIGLFFLLGIEIRHTALFLEFWLFLSLLYFGEVVWPHLILIGIPIAFFLHGYDRPSLEGMFFVKGRREPIL